MVEKNSSRYFLHKIGEILVRMFGLIYHKMNQIFHSLFILSAQVRNGHAFSTDAENDSW